MNKKIARLDIYRDKRCAIPEVVLAEGKEPEWVAELLIEMVKAKGIAIATRVSKDCFREIENRYLRDFILKHYERAKMVVLTRKDYVGRDKKGKVGLMAAGTADIPVAEEARITMEYLGCEVLSVYDVGIAGIHRLFSPLDEMLKEKVACIIVIAGMEGALPAVVKSLVDVPVIGVPTSVGYGYGGGGKSALMAMLQSCSPGLTVVNIDNGFGAGCAASLIISQVQQAQNIGVAIDNINFRI